MPRDFELDPWCGWLPAISLTLSQRLSPTKVLVGPPIPPIFTGGLVTDFVVWDQLVRLCRLGSSASRNLTGGLVEQSKKNRLDDVTLNGEK